MYVRLAFWNMAMAYTGFLFAHGDGGSSTSILLTGALLGALMGFAVGAMFANRVKRWPS